MLIETKGLLSDNFEIKIYRMEIDSKWYNNTALVGTLVICFLPLGLYGLYKSENIDRRAKMATYIGIALGLIALGILVFN